MAATTMVTAQYLRPNIEGAGTVCKGRVRFRLVAATYHDGLNAIFPTVPVTKVLVDGAISVPLAPTSGADAQFDSNTMTYEVSEHIDGADRDPYYVDVPTAAGSVDLGTLATYADPPFVVRELVVPDLSTLGVATDAELAAHAAAANPHAVYVTKLSVASNVSVGTLTLPAITTGVTNVAIGNISQQYNQIGSCNVSVGPASLVNVLADDNVAVGSNALTADTSGHGNVAVGTWAMMSNVIQHDVTAVGFSALKMSTAAAGCAVGGNALTANTTGAGNTAVGHNALRAMTTGEESVAIGRDALYSLNTSGESVGVGSYALRSVTSSSNTAIGYSAGYTPAGLVANATGAGAYQTLVGRYTGQSAAGSISRLTAVGNSATGGSNATAVGDSATASGADSVALGRSATASHVNAVALGYGSTTTANDQVMVGPRDVELTASAKGVVLKSPDGTRYRVTVANGGTLSVTAA